MPGGRVSQRVRFHLHRGMDGQACGGPVTAEVTFRCVRMTVSPAGASTILVEHVTSPDRYPVERCSMKPWIGPVHRGDLPAHSENGRMAQKAGHPCHGGSVIED